MARLRTTYPGAYVLAALYARGHSESELAELLCSTEPKARAALNLIFSTLARYMNGESDSDAGDD